MQVRKVIDHGTHKEHVWVSVPRPSEEFDPNKMSDETLKAWKIKLADSVEYHIKCSEWGKDIVDEIIKKAG